VTERCIPTVANDRESRIVNAGRIRYLDIIGRQQKGWDVGQDTYPNLRQPLAKMPTGQEHGAEARRQESLVE
jgi:hypothetical protein